MTEKALRIVVEGGGAWLADADGKRLPGQMQCTVDTSRTGSTVTATFYVPREKAPLESEAFWVDECGNARRGAKPS